jgi:hypothetical protein
MSGERREMKTRDKAIRKRIDEVRRGRKKRLSLSPWELGGPIDEIPDEVFELHQLEELNLYGNNIRFIPERIRELTNLKLLLVGRNPIEKLPDIPGLFLDCCAAARVFQVRMLLAFRLEQRNSPLSRINYAKRCRPCLRFGSLRSVWMVSPRRAR